MNVLVCDRAQVPVAAPSLDVIVTVAAQSSVAVAPANAAVIADAAGLQPRVTVLLNVPVNVGDCVSLLHVTVLDAEDVFPQPSVATNVLVCDLLQVPVTLPSLEFIVTVAVQLSVAAALLNAPLIAEAAGLHPRVTVLLIVPVKPGACVSLVQVTVLRAVAVLPQPSVAVNVLVCDLVQVPLAAPSLDVMETVAVQLSVAVASDKALAISEASGLQPSVTVLLIVPVKLGAWVSLVQITVLDAVAVLPQPSVAVNVLVCDLEQVPVAAPSLDVIVTVTVQLSVAVAPFNAAVIAEAAGLHARVTVLLIVPVKAGACVSFVQMTVRDTVAVLPQPSVAVNVLVCD